jgi:hypothetical protein
VIQDQEKRREEVKKNSIAITRANEKPFSFYERDKDKPKKVKEDFSFKSKQFKAAEVPWFCSTELYAREQEFRENQRMERVNRRAQEVELIDTALGNIQAASENGEARAAAETESNLGRAAG